MEKTTRQTNTVHTVLTQSSVSRFEHLLYWFWNNFDHEAATRNLMKMLGVYIRHEPEDVHQLQKAYCLADFVCDLIELKEEIKEIQESEQPWEWEDTPDGWGLPIKKTASEY